MSGKQHRFNFESEYEEKQYDRLVKICKAPLAWIEENIEYYDLLLGSASEVADRMEREYAASQK